jgi:hypothetical protein
VFRATNGGVRATKFWSGVLQLSELEAAEIMRKAEPRLVVEFRAINRGNANPSFVLLMKPESPWSDVALLAGLLSQVGGTFVIKEAEQNNPAPHACHEYSFVWPPMLRMLFLASSSTTRPRFACLLPSRDAAPSP